MFFVLSKIATDFKVLKVLLTVFNCSDGTNRSHSCGFIGVLPLGLAQEKLTHPTTKVREIRRERSCLLLVSEYSLVDLRKLLI